MDAETEEQAANQDTQGQQAAKPHRDGYAPQTADVSRDRHALRNADDEAFSKQEVGENKSAEENAAESKTGCAPDGVSQAKQAGQDSSSSDTCDKSLQGLDFLNLFMADVQTGVGPYLAIFLKSARHFNPAQVGMAMAAASIAQVVAQAPAGAFIDKTTQKRLLVGIAAVLIAVGAIMIALISNLWAVIAAQALIGGAGAVFAPAIAALTLGIVGRALLTKRQSRNEAFNHAGNVLAALLFGFVGYKLQSGIFWCVAALSLGTIWAAWRIQEQDIDHQRASGAADDDDAKQAAPKTDEAAQGESQPGEPQKEEEQKKGQEGEQQDLLSIFKDKRVLIFAASVVLFHSANAAMLPLVGQLLGGDKSKTAPLYMSACIIVAQLVMVPVALTVGKLAPGLGHKKIFLVGIASVAVRGLLFAFVRNHYALVAVQALDGIGAGIFGVLNVLIIASLMRGTGRFNFAQGAIAASIGIGGGLSNAATGFLVKHSGYKAGFLALSVVAVIAFAFFLTLMPETNDDGEEASKNGKDDISSQEDDRQKQAGGQNGTSEPKGKA